MSLIRYNSYLTPEQIDQLRKIYTRTGIRPSEQIRRAVEAWLGRDPERRAHERLEKVVRKVVKNAKRRGPV